jgi:hypothetical protein
VTFYTWQGGGLNDPLSWTPQPPNGSPPPGLLDNAEFQTGGTLQGSLNIFSADFSSASFDLDGSIVTTFSANVGSTTFIVKSGSTLATSGFITLGATHAASITQLGGTIVAGSNEFIYASAPKTLFTQQGGLNTIGGYLEVGVAGSGTGNYRLARCPTRMRSSDSVQQAY